MNSFRRLKHRPKRANEALKLAKKHLLVFELINFLFMPNRYWFFAFLWNFLSTGLASTQRILKSFIFFFKMAEFPAMVSSGAGGGGGIFISNNWRCVVIW